MTKQSSPYVDNQRFKFDERQLRYIEKSYQEALKVEYMKPGQVFEIEKPRKYFADLDKADLYLPAEMYVTRREAWDNVPL